MTETTDQQPIDTASVKSEEKLMLKLKPIYFFEGLPSWFCADIGIHRVATAQRGELWGSNIRTEQTNCHTNIDFIDREAIKVRIEKDLTKLVNDICEVDFSTHTLVSNELLAEMKSVIGVYGNPRNWRDTPECRPMPLKYFVPGSWEGIEPYESAKSVLTKMEGEKNDKVE